jgi:hypothetical protein
VSVFLDTDDVRSEVHSGMVGERMAPVRRVVSVR